MKRRTAVTAAGLVLVMLFAQCAFASDGMLTTTAPPVTSSAPVTSSGDVLTAPNGTLTVVKTVPGDGETGKQPANFAVKIVFSEDMSSTANDAANAKLIKITDAEGKEQAFELVHHEKYPNELWCILKADLVTDTEYTVSVGSGIQATGGNVLASGMSFGFKTRDAKKDSTISIIMTIGMIVIMGVATSQATKKQNDENSGKTGAKVVPAEKITSDPYRLAKERGISLDEAKELIAKEKEKEAKRNASAEKARAKFQEAQDKKEAEIQRRLQEIHDASVYKVKGKCSMKAHGKQIPKALAKKLAAKHKKKK